MRAKDRLIPTLVLLCLLAFVPQVQASELFEKQVQFTRNLSRLLQRAEALGYQITVGDAWATQGHSWNSRHKCRLAIDLNLFWEGRYLTKTDDHALLGMYWEELGGRWGGRWGDGNHYEIWYKGKC